MKIFEGLTITFFTQLAGSVRQKTGSYTFVSALLTCVNLVSVSACLVIANQDSSIIGTFSNVLSRLMDMMRLKSKDKLCTTPLEKK